MDWVCSMGCWSSASDIAQIEREREVAVRNFRRRREPALLVAMPEKPCQPPALSLIAVHRERVMAESARVRDVIGATPERTLVPGVVKVKPQRRVRRNRRLQAIRRLPRAITHARDAFPVRA